MLDPVSQSLAAVSTGSVTAVPLVFLAGAATSIGPCVAPRFIAVAGMAAGKTRGQTLSLAAAFIAGLTVTYAAFGAVSSLLIRAAQLSTLTYIAIAVLLGVGGLLTLWREQRQCSHAQPHRRDAGVGASFLLGASFALVVSPCCTPLVVGILAYSAAAGSTVYASALLACFALGHALPIIAVAFGVQRVGDVLGRHSVRQAASVISGTLMLGLAGYYAILA